MSIHLIFSYASELSTHNNFKIVPSYSLTLWSVKKFSLGNLLSIPLNLKSSLFRSPEIAVSKF